MFILMYTFNILNVYKPKNERDDMKNLERKTIGELDTNSLRGVSFFSGDINNNLMATIVGVFEDKITKEVIVEVNYPSTGTHNYHSFDSCKKYYVAKGEEVKKAIGKFKDYSE